MMRPSPVSSLVGIGCVVGGHLGLDLAQLRQAEVEHLHAAVRRDHDVARLQIAMGDAALVRGADGVAHADTDPQQRVERQAAAGIISPSGLPSTSSIVRNGNAVGLFDRVDGDDVRDG